MAKEVTIYTDGACRGNPGPGGWAAVLLCNGHEKEITGREDDTTNQRMEMMAALQGLKALNQPCRVLLHTDSAYLVNAFNQDWLQKWQRNGWMTSKKEPVANQDLWKELLAMNRKHRVEWIKVKGHSDNELNNRADKLAKKAVDQGQEGGPSPEDLKASLQRIENLSLEGDRRELYKEAVKARMALAKLL